MAPEERAARATYSLLPCASSCHPIAFQTCRARWRAPETRRWVASSPPDHSGGNSPVRRRPETSQAGTEATQAAVLTDGSSLSVCHLPGTQTSRRPLGDQQIPTILGAKSHHSPASPAQVL